MNTHFQRGQRGQGISEYLIILVGIAVVILVITVVFGGRIKQLFGIADAEVETMGAAELYLDAGTSPGSGGSGTGGSGGSGSGDSGSSGSGGSGSGGGGPSGGSGGGGGGPSGGSGGGGGSGRGGPGAGGAAGGPSSGADSDGIMRASKEGRSGVYTMGEGEGLVTVYSPGVDESLKGSARYDRDLESRQAGAEREVDLRRWDKKRRAAWEAEGGDVAISGEGPNLTILLLLVILVLAGVVGARLLMGGR